MNNQTILADVKKSLGIEGNYQDETVNQYIVEVVDFIIEAGVNSSNITPGLVARGVADLWSYGPGDGKLSEYFRQRVSQLSYKS